MQSTFKPFLCAIWILIASAVLLPVANAQVTVFNAPPSAKELQEALKRGPGMPGKPGQSGLAGRGIEWGNPADQGAAQAQVQQQFDQQPQQQTRPPQGAQTVQTQVASVTREMPPSSPSAGNGPAVAVPVNFDVGSSQIAAPSIAYINAIAAVMTQDLSLRLTVEGHTDASGDPRRNMMLSWDRAYTVFKVLVTRYGIDPARLQPIGKGSIEPIEGTQPTEAVNRRVQFRVIG